MSKTIKYTIVLRNHNRWWTTEYDWTEEYSPNLEELLMDFCKEASVGDDFIFGNINKKVICLNKKDISEIFVEFLDKPEKAKEEEKPIKKWYDRLLGR